MGKMGWMGKYLRAPTKNLPFSFHPKCRSLSRVSSASIVIAKPGWGSHWSCHSSMWVFWQRLPRPRPDNTVICHSIWLTRTLRLRVRATLGPWFSPNNISTQTSEHLNPWWDSCHLKVSNMLYKACWQVEPKFKKSSGWYQVCVHQAYPCLCSCWACHLYSCEPTLPSYSILCNWMRF